jgi:hypothetical protein
VLEPSIKTYKIYFLVVQIVPTFYFQDLYLINNLQRHLAILLKKTWNRKESLVPDKLVINSADLQHPGQVKFVNKLSSVQVVRFNTILQECRKCSDTGSLVDYLTR